MTRQMKFWLIVTLIHLGVIYVFSCARTIAFNPMQQSNAIVSASLLSTNLNQLGTQNNDMLNNPNKSLMASKTAQPMQYSGLNDARVTAQSENFAGTSSENPSKSSPQSSANASATATATQSKPTHLGGYLNNPQPPYPQLSKEADEQGTVTLGVMVEANGLPSSVQVLKSSGYARLDRSARDTVARSYRFIPATQGGVPMRQNYHFDVNFKLKPSF